jgi:hypothetical protein
MSNARQRCGARPSARRTRVRRFVELVGRVLRAFLVIGAAFGPALPPPPPPPPQTVEMKAEDATGEEDA